MIFAFLGVFMGSIIIGTLGGLIGMLLGFGFWASAGVSFLGFTLLRLLFAPYKK